MKVNFFRIDRKIYKQTKSRTWGFYRFEKCSCGCIKYPGWGFCFGIFGFNIQYIKE